MTIAEQIQARIDELLADLSKSRAEERKIAKLLNALPIYPDWSCYIAIRPDGAFLSYTSRGEVEKYVEPEWELIALVRGSKKYPELEVLLPKRTEEASECKDCEGSGRAKIEGRRLEAIICGKCFGLGWVDRYINRLREEARARSNSPADA